MSRFRHGFVASVWGLVLSVASGCGETAVSPQPAASATNAPATTQATKVEEALASRATTPGDDARSSDLQPAVAESDSRPSTVLAADQGDTAPPDATAVIAKAPVETIKPLFDRWTKPAVALVLSGEQHGYLEPCGCSENQ